MPKRSKALQRKYGQLSWYWQLIKAGKKSQANVWANKHRLWTPHPTDPLSCIQASAPATTPTAASPHPATALSDAPLLASPRTATPLPAAYSGGAGVADSQAGQNLDQSGPRGQNSQYESAKQGVKGPSATVGNAADAALLASPSGEVEGKLKSSQANTPINVSNRLENGGWVVSGEGVVGGNCRNRWFVEVQVDGKWAKAAVGDLIVRRGQRVRVRLDWVSADGRDAEYAIVELLPDSEEGIRQAPPVGFAAQGNVGIAHQIGNAQLTKEMASEAVAAQMASEIIEAIEDEPIPQDVLEHMKATLALEEQPTQAEAASENAYDFLERARQEAFKAYSSGQFS